MIDSSLSKEAHLGNSGRNPFWAGSMVGENRITRSETPTLKEAVSKGKWPVVCALHRGGGSNLAFTTAQEITSEVMIVQLGEDTQAIPLNDIPDYLLGLEPVLQRGPANPLVIVDELQSVGDPSSIFPVLQAFSQYVQTRTHKAPAIIGVFKASVERNYALPAQSPSLEPVVLTPTSQREIEILYQNTGLEEKIGLPGVQWLAQQAGGHPYFAQLLGLNVWSEPELQAVLLSGSKVDFQQFARTLLKRGERGNVALQMGQSYKHELLSWLNAYNQLLPVVKGSMPVPQPNPQEDLFRYCAQEYVEGRVC